MGYSIISFSDFFMLRILKRFVIKKPQPASVSLVAR